MTSSSAERQLMRDCSGFATTCPRELASVNSLFIFYSSKPGNMMHRWSLSQLFLMFAMLAAVSCFTDTDPGPAAAGAASSSQPNGDRFKIEGRAIVPGIKTQDWVSTARVLVEGEEYVGFLR